MYSSLIFSTSSCDEFRVDRLGNGFGFVGPVDARTEEFFHLQHRTEGIGACPEVASIGTDVGKGILLLHRDGVPTRMRIFLCFLLNTSAGRRTVRRLGMNQSQEMEKPGIGTLEVDRNHRHPGLFDHLHGRVLPLPVADAIIVLVVAGATSPAGKIPSTPPCAVAPGPSSHLPGWRLHLSFVQKDSPAACIPIPVQSYSE